MNETQERLEYLRGELRAERISYGELAELQSLADQIDPSDVELLEAAGVPEFPAITLNFSNQVWQYKIDPPVFEPDSFGQRLLLSEATVTLLDGEDPEVIVEGRPATKDGRRKANASYNYHGHGAVSDEVKALVLAHWQDEQNGPCVVTTRAVG